MLHVDFIYIYMYICVYIHTYETSIHLCGYAYIKCAHMCAYIWVYVCIYIYMYTLSCHMNYMRVL